MSSTVCVCAASVSERSEANDHVLFEILLCIYVSAPYARRCYSCASLILPQLRKLDGCTLRRMAYSSAAARSSLGSSALWRFFRWCSTVNRSAFAVAGTLPPPLCCALVQYAVVQWFSVCIAHRFTLGVLHLYK